MSPKLDGYNKENIIKNWKQYQKLSSYLIQNLPPMTAINNIYHSTMLSPEVDLPGYSPGTKTNQTTWTLQTESERPIAATNKLAPMMMGSEFKRFYIIFQGRGLGI